MPRDREHIESQPLMFVADVYGFAWTIQVIDGTMQVFDKKVTCCMCGRPGFVRSGARAVTSLYCHTWCTAGKSNGMLVSDLRARGIVAQTFSRRN